MDLKQFLVWLTTPASGVIGYWLVNQIPNIDIWKPEWKRYAAYIVTGVIAIAAYLAQVWLGYVAVPVDAKAWIEALFAVALAAFGVSQFVHAARELSQK